MDCIPKNLLITFTWQLFANDFMLQRVLTWFSGIGSNVTKQASGGSEFENDANKLYNETNTSLIYLATLWHIRNPRLTCKTEPSRKNS